MDSTKINYDPYLGMRNQSTGSRFDGWLNHINGSTEEPTTKSPSDNGGNTNLNESYKMAAQVAVGAAIIVALTILLALIWNSLKKRLPNTNNSGTSSSTSRRYSSDSFDRLVEDRLRNRPPPYSPDQDKPPSYEESFHDSSSRHRSPNICERNVSYNQICCTQSRRLARRRYPRDVPHVQMPTVHETNRYPAQTVGQEPPVSFAQPMAEPSVCYSMAVRTVSYDNRAFSVDEEEHHQPTVSIPSISIAVHENEVSHGCQTPDTEEGVVMLHL